MKIKFFFTINITPKERVNLDVFIGLRILIIYTAR